jgi:hypothetical protein
MALALALVLVSALADPQRMFVRLAVLVASPAAFSCAVCLPNAIMTNHRRPSPLHVHLHGRKNKKN